MEKSIYCSRVSFEHFKTSQVSVIGAPFANPSESLYLTHIMEANQQIIGFLSEHLPALKGVYLFGSRAEGRARPDSDIDLLVHFAGDQTRLYQLECWFQGWSLALAEMNYSRTGVRLPKPFSVAVKTDYSSPSATSTSEMPPSSWMPDSICRSSSFSTSPGRKKARRR